MAGTFSFVSPELAPGAGTALQELRFTPADGANYVAVLGTVSVTVNKALPELLAAPAASPIVRADARAVRVDWGIGERARCV